MDYRSVHENYVSKFVFCIGLGFEKDIGEGFICIGNMIEMGISGANCFVLSFVK
jgi:hypothetical protein